MTLVGVGSFVRSPRYKLVSVRGTCPACISRSLGVSPSPPQLLSRGYTHVGRGGSVAEWLACGTQAQKGPGSNRSRDAVG